MREKFILVLPCSNFYKIARHRKLQELQIVIQSINQSIECSKIWILCTHLEIGWYIFCPNILKNSIFFHSQYYWNIIDYVLCICVYIVDSCNDCKCNVLFYIPCHFISTSGPKVHTGYCCHFEAVSFSYFSLFRIGLQSTLS